MSRIPSALDLIVQPASTPRPARLLPLALLALVFGCPEADTGGSGGGTTGGDGTPPLPGHEVVCCFNGAWDYTNPPPHSAWGCAEAPNTECMDPEASDQNGNGTFEDTELAAFCQQKCAGGWTSGTVTTPDWTIYGGTPGTWFDSCSAIVGGTTHKSHVHAENTCNPLYAPVVTYDKELDVPPTHETSFSSGSSQSSVDISIIGNALTAAYALDIQFALHRCDRDGVNGGSCTLVLSAFDLTTTSPMQVGDYWAIDGALTLNARVAAEVSFTPCSHGVCTGTFEFSDTESNPIGVNLFWTQRNVQTSSVDDAAIHLSNGSGGLGGLESLSGVLKLDRSAEYGELRLVGGGSDRFGGDWASVDFDIVGDVAPL